MTSLLRPYCVCVGGGGGGGIAEYMPNSELDITQELTE